MVGLEVIVLGSKAVAAVQAFGAVEVGRVSQLQGEADFDRRVSGPTPHVTEVLAVVKDPGEKGV